MRVRFAPSPTGKLHIGGARTALFNYLIAKNSGGKFILRIDDTDLARSTKENEEDILNSLRWLGLNWDEGPDTDQKFYQTNRVERHVEVANELLKNEKAYKDHEGVVRIKYPEGNITVDDLILGPCSFETKDLGLDPVILRSDGRPTYHLASCVDDADFKISHIIRGQDHLTNTTKHIALFNAMDVEMPKFAHLPLILGTDGSKLSKRNTESFTTVKQFMDHGYIPEALNNFLMLLGWSHPDEEENLSIEDVTKHFNLERLNQTPAKFETPKLDYLNGWWIRHLEAKQIADKSIDFVGEYKELIEQRAQNFWPDLIDTFKEKFVFLSDVKKICSLVFDLNFELDKDLELAEYLPVIKSWKEYVSEIELEGDSLSTEQFKAFIKPYKKDKTVPQKTVFHALRVAITGELSGPDLSLLIPFIKREALLSRADSILA